MKETAPEVYSRGEHDEALKEQVAELMNTFEPTYGENWLGLKLQKEFNKYGITLSPEEHILFHDLISGVQFLQKKELIHRIFEFFAKNSDKPDDAGYSYPLVGPLTMMIPATGFDSYLSTEHLALYKRAMQNPVIRGWYLRHFLDYLEILAMADQDPLYFIEARPSSAILVEALTEIERKNKLKTTEIGKYVRMYLTSALLVEADPELLHVVLKEFHIFPQSAPFLIYMLPKIFEDKEAKKEFLYIVRQGIKNFSSQQAWSTLLENKEIAGELDSIYRHKSTPLPAGFYPPNEPLFARPDPNKRKIIAVIGSEYGIKIDPAAPVSFGFEIEPVSKSREDGQNVIRDARDEMRTVPISSAIDIPAVLEIGAGIANKYFTREYAYAGNLGTLHFSVAMDTEAYREFVPHFEKAEEVLGAIAVATVGNPRLQKALMSGL